MNYWLIFLTGLTTGGFTCAAMQGGILASLIANQKNAQIKKGFGIDDWGPVASFLTAKLLSHLLLGLLLGALGSVVELSLTTRLIFQGFAALFMLFTALNLLEVHPIFRYVCITPPKFIYKFIKNNENNNLLFAPAIFGLMTIFIPCGVTQAMAVIAISSGSAISGALTMGSFIAGTIPIFAMIGLGTATLGEYARKDFLRVAAIALIIMAFTSFNGILLVEGSPYSLQRIGPKLVRLLPPYDYVPSKPVSDPNVAIENGIQKVHIGVANNGYSPSYFRVQHDLPVELSVETKGQVYSCATSFTFKAFNIADVLGPTDSKVHIFTPTKIGLYTYSCSMGMYSGTMEVI